MKINITSDEAGIVISSTKGLYAYHEDLFKAQMNAGTYLSPEQDAYVAGLLYEYSDCPDLLSVSTSVLCLEGHYREAGDRSLILSAIRSPLKNQYIHIGTMAYSNLRGNPYADLAAYFKDISGVLQRVFL